MKKLLFVLAALLFPFSAHATSTLYSNSTSVGIGTTSPQSELQVYAGEAQIGSSGAACSASNAGALRYAGGSGYICDGTNWDVFGGSSGGTLPPLTSADIWVGNASNVATAVALSGDCTLSNAGAINCTKTNGTAFGTLATQYAVNLSSQAAGTLQAAQFPALTGDVTTTAGSVSTTVAAIQGTTVGGTTGTGNVVFSTSPALTGSPTAPTQSSGDNSTNIATTAFVQSAVSGSGSGIKSVHVQTFTSSGTYTPTTGMSYVKVQMIGGGGAGGGVPTSIQGAAGGGGSSGTISEGIFSAANIGASQTVTIGAGGTPSAGNAGGNGGTTSLGSLMTALGGIGGAVGAQAGYASPNTAIGGNQTSVGSGGYLNLPSAPGGNGGGTAFNDSSYCSGAGGNGLNGVGGASSIQNYESGGGASQTNGNAGANNGSGGSGGGGQVATSAVSGGAGGSGMVIITEYCTQ